MPAAAGPQPTIVDPFAPFLSPTLTRNIKNLLISDRVQEINFDFGSVLVHAYHFREIAKMFATQLHEKGIHVVINPEYIRQESTADHPRDAVYSSDYDAIYFKATDALDGEEGRALAVHECVHVVCDYRRRVTAIRSEEGAAMVAQVWYQLSSDDVVLFDEFYGPIWEIADRLRNRWLATGKPVPLRGSEINAVRAHAARMGYENAHYSHDGIIT